MMNRRHFLGTTSAAVLASMAPRSAHAAQNTQVLIVGAGMSGVSAAFWLNQFGISSIILEARSRLGGRLFTSTELANTPLDIGGAWIHDSLNSPLTPLTKIFNIQTFLTDFRFRWFGTNFAELSDLQIAKIAASYAAVFAKFKLQTELLKAAQAPDQTVDQVITPILNELQLVAEPWEYYGVQVLVDQGIRNHFGVELRELSLYHYDQDKNLTQAFDLAFPGGYVQLVQALKDGSGQQVVQNCVVSEIQYDGPSGVTVKTSQGDFTATYALITAPLGVLKRTEGQTSYIKFTPSLPDWKRDAINRLAMGVWDKIAIQFPQAFWGNTQLLRSTNPPEQGTIWFNPVPMVNKPIIVPVIWGDLSRLVAQAFPTSDPLSNPKLMKYIVDNIIKPWAATVAPGFNVPDGVALARSDWGNDPYAFGCYPHIPLGATGVDYDLMSLPVPFVENPKRLFFAGDGTHREHAGSAWGAYESGVREATRIASYFQQQQKAIKKNDGKKPFLASIDKNAKARLDPALVWKSYDNTRRKVAYKIAMAPPKKKAKK